MDSEVLKPLLGSLARHGLTAAGTYLGLTGEASTQFVGAGMVLAGLVWAWWQKRGQEKFIAVLAKMHPVASPTASTQDAVKAATDAVNAVNAATVVKILIAAFLLSGFLFADPASAKEQRAKPHLHREAATLVMLTGNLKNDLQNLTGTKLTGQIADDLISALDTKLLPDLKYAKLLAEASGSKVTAPCWEAWADVITVRQKAVQDDKGQDVAMPDPAVITKFEKLVEIRNMLQPDSNFMIKCSPVASMVGKDIRGLMGLVVSGGAGLAALGIGL